MEMAIIGLGKMGTGLALNALEKGIRVVGITRSSISLGLYQAGLEEASSLEDLVKKLKTPRKIFLYIPAGPPVEELIANLEKLLSPGDIIVDGGNSYWGDSMKRYKRLSSEGIHLLDLGTSGGISGARSGACFMVGGDREAYEEVEPILSLMAVTEGCAYVGPSGCGHLVKLIHNGIEFGMLQAIGEGMALLEKFKESLPIDMEAVFKSYRNGSVIRSWLIDLMAQQYHESGEILKVPSHVEDTGEVNWLVEDALHLEVPIPVISQSVMELFRSRDKNLIDYRAVALMRHGFGGHPFGPKHELEIERQISRIDPSFEDSLIKKSQNTSIDKMSNDGGDGSSFTVV